jgi:hypothetical protein
MTYRLKADYLTIYDKYRAKVAQLTNEQLMYLVKEHDKWFDNWSTIPVLRKTIEENNSRGCWIDLIMMADPIFTKDGLIAFLSRKLPAAKRIKGDK